MKLCDSFRMTIRVACALCNDKDVKDTFWKEVERDVEEVNPGEKLSMMGDMNEWMEDYSRRRNERVNYGIPGEWECQ